MALSKVDVANMLTGVTPVANGGTALSSGFNNGLWVKLGETNITSATGNVEFDVSYAEASSKLSVSKIILVSVSLDTLLEGS